jgi:DNA-binding MarR family transcriptional regulator
MVARNEARSWKEPESLAELRLPPNFVYDHCIRTLSYQGSLSPTEIARHWHVEHEIAFEVVDALKAAGIVEIDAGQSTFDRAARVRLSAQGQTRVAAARARTWYAGALPVPVQALGERVRKTGALAQPARVQAALQPFAVAPGATAEIGQAIAAGATVNLSGLAPEEQPALAEALGDALDGEVSLPYAIFAAGAVMRLFDPHVHAAIEERQQAAELDILRTRETESQWVRTRRPCVLLSGGILGSDVLPAYDDDAHFYLAPTPLKASGGVLAAAASDESQALDDLARLWLAPGMTGSGIVLLRSGERMEVPWHAATLLLSDAPLQAGGSVAPAILYRIDVAELRGDALRRWLRDRLSPLPVDDAVVDLMATRLEEHSLATRGCASRAATYISDRAAYEGTDFRATPDVAGQAVAFAGRHAPLRDHRRAA